MGSITNSNISSAYINTATTIQNTNCIIEANNGYTYVFFGQIAATYGIWYIKSNDGINWSLPAIINTTAPTDRILSISTWYDRWSNINSDIIHISWFASTGTQDVYYKNLDTNNNDALSSEYTVFVGASALAGGSLSITRTRGGNLICGGCIDAGTELFCYKSTNIGVNWSSIAAISEATTDQLILLPGWAADTNDAMCFFYDASAQELSRKLYDDSANSWSESSIATSIIYPTTSFTHFSAAVDITNSQNLLVAWSAVDTANADLRCWKITEGAITEVTNIVLNSADDQGLCAIGVNINTQDWYVFYGGKSDGSETWNTSINIYYKVSKDGGSTWSSETKISSRTYVSQWMSCVQRFYNIPKLVMFQDTSTIDYLIYMTYQTNSRTTFQLGM